MAKILVKQVQPQLMQMPKEGKSLGEFAGALFSNPFSRKNKFGLRNLAGLAGVAGKLGAGLSTVNDTMQTMQGGNISAPLGMGYTFEAKDPTGRMISQYAEPKAVPAQRAKVNQVPLPGQNTTPPAPTTVLPANPTTDHLNYQSPIPPLPAPTASQPGPAGTPQDYGFAPAPFPIPQQTVTGRNPPPLPLTPAPGHVQSPFPMVGMTNPPQPTINPATGQPYPTLMPQDSNDPNAKKSFVTALTEKLGADVVYKMSPHEVGTFAAYTLLKLR